MTFSPPAIAFATTSGRPASNREGKRAKAGGPGRTVYGWFIKDLGTTYLIDAKALLADVGSWPNSVKAPSKAGAISR